jgi:translation initiation factor IF-2
LSKVKVFTLAKKFGFKSAEFVDILKSLGFPVSSYQASLEEWDVPVIEQRLMNSGLVGSNKPTGDGATADSPVDANAEAPAPSWADLMRTARTNEDAAPPAAPVAPAAAAAPAPAPAKAAPAPATPVIPEPTRAAPTPLPAGGARILRPPMPTGPVPRPMKRTPAPAAPAAAPGTGASAAPSAPAASGASAPTVGEEKSNGQDSQPLTATGAAGTAPDAAGITTDPVTGIPTPKPRSATRVGRIDLAALGLIRTQQELQRKTSTFTDLREKESSRHRDLRQKQREKMRDRRAGRVRPKESSTLERKHQIVLEPPVTVKSFSGGTGIPVTILLQRLMDLDVMSNINAALDADTIELLAAEFDVGVRIKEETDLEAELLAEIQAVRHAVDDSTLTPRPPVIAFLGHVDHGKTTLIDAIRSSRVAAKEAGGITQHIGAYVATLPNGKSVTILDTPGHQAFTGMRQRGARATDIAVLVVAADDGIMPQTEEAAAHARAANVPVVVAINKMDAPGANAQQVKSQLSGMGLQPEEWGGSTGVVEVSGLHKKGIDALLERILLEAELLGLKAHSTGDAMGVVLEATLEKGKGKVATVLVQDGTLRSKDVVLAGTTYGKIRLMFDHAGKPLKEAGPGTPVQILGLEELPPIGEKFYVVDELQSAKDVAEKRALLKTERDRREKSANVTAANLFDKLDESQVERLRYVLKADAQGSLEVIKKTLEEFGNEEVMIEVMHAGVGGVTESDVLLASTAKAAILAFNVVPEGKARKEAERVRVAIREYEVIYELFEAVEKEIAGKLEPEAVETVIGSAEVLQIFRSSRWGAVAGCRVTSGVLRRNCVARVIRDGKKVFEAPFDSLRVLKDDVREVEAPKECGLKVKNFEDIKVGDVIEAVSISGGADAAGAAEAAS